MKNQVAISFLGLGPIAQVGGDLAGLAPIHLANAAGAATASRSGKTQGKLLLRRQAR
jgi:hypothetical protein